MLCGTWLARSLLIIGQFRNVKAESFSKDSGRLEGKACFSLTFSLPPPPGSGCHHVTRVAGIIMEVLETLGQESGIKIVRPCQDPLHIPSWGSIGFPVTALSSALLLTCMCGVLGVASVVSGTAFSYLGLPGSPWVPVGFLSVK